MHKNKIYYNSYLLHESLYYYYISVGAVIRVGWGWGSGVVIALSTLVVGRPGGHHHQGGRIVNAGGVVGHHGHCHIVDTGDGVVVVGGGVSQRE